MSKILDELAIIPDKTLGRLFKLMIDEGMVRMELSGDLSKIYDKPKSSTIPSWEDFQSYAYSVKNNVDNLDLKIKYQAWKENGWRDGKNQTIKNWKSKLLQTLPHLKEGNVRKPTQLQPQVHGDYDKIKAENDAKYIKMLADKKRQDPNYSPSEQYKQEQLNLTKLKTQDSEFRERNKNF